MDTEKTHSPNFFADRKFAMVVFFLLMGWALLAQQAPLKDITEQEYARWGKLRQEGISDKGRWASYIMAYDSGEDTLFVSKIGTGIRHSIPKGNSGQFAGERWFACGTGQSGMKVADLNSGKTEQFPNAVSWQFVNENALLIVSETPDETTLKLVDLENLKSRYLSTETAFSVAPNGNFIVFTMRDSIGSKIALYEVKTRKTTILALGEKEAFSNWAWDGNGTAVAFFEKANKAYAKIHYYMPEQKMARVFEIGKYPELSNWEMANSGALRLAMAKDGKRVFFGIREKQPENEPEIVQLWNGSDNWIYPMWRGSEKNWNAVPKLAVWYPETGKYAQITSDALPVVVLDGAQRFAIAHNPAAKKWEDTETGKPDWWIAEIGKHGFEHLLSSHSADQNQTSIDPLQSRVAYFQNNAWWVHDFENKWERCISASIPQQLAGEGSHGGMAAYGVAGWAADGEGILIYDEYDIWLSYFSGGKAERLTQGREKKRRYRMESVSTGLAPVQNFSGIYARSVTLEIGFTVNAINTETFASGWYEWTPKKGLQEIAYGDAKLTQLLKAKNAPIYTFISERFDSPPALRTVTENKIPKLIFQSNAHYKKYKSGKSKLIHYRDTKGNSLAATLCYPAGYDASKKYPMIVQIYEKMASRLNSYVNPSVFNGDGFNVANLIAQNYFVLLPDIKYEIGNPGITATECVLAAVDEAIRAAPIDDKKLGLTGHSFGDYETNFIITQTNRFAAAVAGAGASDLQSWYLTVGWDSGTPEAWRFEDQQWRMGKSLFDDPDGYARNSPVVNAQKVTTPLLGWTGAEDRQVNWQQAIEYYLALKKLDKEQILLVYPEEGHEIIGKIAQKDLTLRIESWFAHYLKNSTAERWISEGTK